MTVREIAEQVGCSEATVSRVLNGNPAVDEELRNSVLAVAREVHYRREGRGRKSQAAARSPVKGIVEIICLQSTPYEPLAVQNGAIEVGPLQCAPSADASQTWARRGFMSNSFYQPILSGITSELRQWNVRSSLQVVEHSLDSELIAAINQPDVAGVVLLGGYGFDLSPFVSLCRHPLVMVDLTCAAQAERVQTDNMLGVFDGFAHLTELGHRRIGFIGGPEVVSSFQDRLLAYKLKMVESGLPINPKWISQTANHIEQTTKAVREILLQKERPTALMCCNDMAALGVYRAASELNLEIPRDLSVVGFDDVDFASLITPALTTLAVPKMEMGRVTSRQLMLQMLASESAFGFSAVHMVPAKLVKRASTAQVLS